MEGMIARPIEAAGDGETKARTLLVFIGRFQPFHLGHAHVLEQSLASGATVLVLVGSANRVRSTRDPWTADERDRMIAASFPDAAADGRLRVAALDDHLYNDTAWIAAVQRRVAEAAAATEAERVALVGWRKDGTSYYLRLFPEWGEVALDSPFGAFDATAIRRDYLRRAPILPRDSCPEPVVEALRAFRTTPEFARLVAEAEWIDAYRRSWAAAPFPPVFVSVDCVVVQAGHVLLVRRGAEPGKGLLALPGGFVGEGETLREAAVRELREETSLADGKGQIPPAMLASFIEDRATRTFDAPHRSARGRTITHAFLFRCPARRSLFRVQGGDDAAEARWVPLADIRPTDLFEDHWFILEEMTGL